MKNNGVTKQRLYELDFLRGSAIIIMIVIHILHILNLLGDNYNYPLGTGYLLYLSRAGAAIFILLAGISLIISSAKAASFARTAKRGLKIFSWGMFITLITWLSMGEGFIVFGILHFMGTSLLLSYPFLSLGNLNLFMGVIVLLLSIPLSRITVFHPWFLWLGLKPSGFYTLDYFPLVPWFGIFLTGVFLGNTLYPGGQRKYYLQDFSKAPPVKLLCLAGRNSLKIYLAHIPLLLILLYVLGYIDITNLINLP